MKLIDRLIVQAAQRFPALRIDLAYIVECSAGANMFYDLCEGYLQRKRINISCGTTEEALATLDALISTEYPRSDPVILIDNIA